MAKPAAAAPPASEPRVFKDLDAHYTANKASTVIDLPRLVRRVTVTANNEHVLFHPIFSDPDKSVQRSFMLIVDLLISLHRLLHGADNDANNSEELEVQLLSCITVEEGKTLEAESVCRQMLDIIKQRSAKSYGALKMVSQSVILLCMIELKSTILQHCSTRDVRTEDGWRINLDVSPTLLTITHARRELSGEGKREFHFEWQIVMEFDAQLVALQRTVLRINNCHFAHPNELDAEEQAKIKRELRVGAKFEEVRQ